jgi:hypothetical protein
MIPTREATRFEGGALQTRGSQPFQDLGQIYTRLSTRGPQAYKPGQFIKISW